MNVKALAASSPLIWEVHQQWNKQTPRAGRAAQGGPPGIIIRSCHFLRKGKQGTCLFICLLVYTFIHHSFFCLLWKISDIHKNRII